MIVDDVAAKVTTTSTVTRCTAGYQNLVYQINDSSQTLNIFDIDKNWTRTVANQALGNSTGSGGIAFGYTNAAMAYDPVANKLYIAGTTTTPYQLKIVDVAANNMTVSANCTETANRNGASVAVDTSGYVYLIGGGNSATAPTAYAATMERYNPSTNTWTTMAAPPFASANSWLGDALVYNNKIYVVMPASSGMYIYDIAGNTWTTVTGVQNQGLYYRKLVSDGTNIYAVGGSRTTSTNSLTRVVTRLNVATGKLQMVGALNDAVSRTNVFYRNGVFWRLGGYTITTGSGGGTASSNLDARPFMAYDKFAVTPFGTGGFGSSATQTTMLASNGVLVVFGCSSGAITYTTSSDGGVTWAALTTIATLTSSTYNHGSAYLDEQDNLHIVYVDTPASTPTLYYRRGTPNAARTTYTFSAATTVMSSTRSTSSPAIVAFTAPSGSGWVAHVVWDNWVSPTSTVYHRELTISSTGTVALAGSQNTVGTYSSTTQTGLKCRLMFETATNARTPKTTTPNLCATWEGSGTTQGCIAKYNSGTSLWAWGTAWSVGEMLAWIVYNSVTSAWETLLRPSGATHQKFSRDAADTASTTTTYETMSVTAQYDSRNWFTDGYKTVMADASGNLYYFGTDDYSYCLLLGVYSKDRAVRLPIVPVGNAGSDQTSTALAPTVIYDSANSRAYVFLASYGTVVPVSNVAPSASTGLSPSGGVQKQASSVIRLAWVFTDSDGDYQLSYSVRYRKVGDATWTTVTATTLSSFYDIPAYALSGATYEWQVATTDEFGAIGPYTASSTFVALAGGLEGWMFIPI